MAVPTARTFETLKDNILRYLKLKDDTEADTLAGEAIRAGLIRLAGYPLKGLRATADITLTTGANTVALPADFSMALSLHELDTDSNRDGRIVYKGEEDFDFLVPDNDAISGVPQIYTVRENDGDVIEFDRTPTSEHITVIPKVRLRYYRRIDILNTSTSTFSIPPEFEEFLIWFGRKELSGIYNTEKFPLAQQEEGRALAALIRRDTVRDEQDWV